jgi:hypothetical protein
MKHFLSQQIALVTRPRLTRQTHDILLEHPRHGGSGNLPNFYDNHKRLRRTAANPSRAIERAKPNRSLHRGM